MRRLISRLAALLISTALSIGIAGPLKIKAAEITDTPNYGNTIIFARFSDDQSDVFNLEYTAYSHTYRNHDLIKQMYDQGNENYNNSTKAFIAAISEHKVILDDYFPQESGGKFGIYTFSKKKDGYSSSYDLVNEIIGAVNAGTIPFDISHQTDYNGDGCMDNLTLIVQGGTDDTSDVVYPHRTTYSGNPISRSGKELIVADYNVLPSEELVKSSSDDSYYGNKQGVISHELMHSLGFPDLYRYSGKGNPVGAWDIMGSDSVYQCYPLGYLRQKLGYITLATTDKAGHFTIDKVDTSGSGNLGLIIRTPMSDTEFFVVEYRYRPAQTEAIMNQAFESGLPMSTYGQGGLIIYRVNTAYSTNKADGEDFLYVFRPSPSSLSNDDSTVVGAAVEPAAGETEYGSLDLTKAYNEGTIYYSDGRNSGIQLSGMTLSDDGKSISFDLTLADYSASGIWSNYGSGLSASAVNATAAAKGSELYAAYEYVQDETSKIKIIKSSGAVFTDVASLSGYSSPKISFSGETLILTVLDSNGYLRCWKQTDGSLVQLWKSDGYPSGEIRFLSYGGRLYVYYVRDNTELEIRDALTGTKYFTGLTGSLLANPALAVYKGSLYALASDIDGSDKHAIVYSYQGSAWSKAKVLGQSSTNVHALTEAGGRLLAFVQGSSGSGHYYEFDGSAWSDDRASSLGQLSSVQLFSVNGRGVLSGISATTNNAEAYWVDDQETAIGTAITGNALELSAQGSQGTIYACAALSAADGEGPLVVKYFEAAQPYTITFKNGDGTILSTCNLYYGDQVTAPATPTKPNDGQYSYAFKEWSPALAAVSGDAEYTAVYTATALEAATDYTITLTLPNGYSGQTVYIDGKAKTGTIGGGKISVTADDDEAKTAVMYQYDGTKPTGMRCWILMYASGTYTAETADVLTDLLSYHGFSIRITGKSGIRFESGIASAAKKQLISEGLGGFRLDEYGTMVVPYLKLANNPGFAFVKPTGTGSPEAVKAGRAYWTDGSGTHDLVFKSQNRRDHFTSVLVGLPAAYYKTEYAFRAYIILEKAGKKYIFYGPIMHRSIYAIAQQLIARGDFPAGSSADLYVRKIVQEAQ